MTLTAFRFTDYDVYSAKSLLKLTFLIEFLPNLYRIVNTCAELGFDSHPSYQGKLPSLSKIPVPEQIKYVNSNTQKYCLNIFHGKRVCLNHDFRCHKDIMYSQETGILTRKYNQVSCFSQSLFRCSAIYECLFLVILIICQHLPILNKSVLYIVTFQRAKLGEEIFSERLSEDLSSQNIWREKAEVCLSLGLYQSARQLLVEAHKVAKVG